MHTLVLISHDGTAETKVFLDGFVWCASEQGVDELRDVSLVLVLLMARVL